ncbi:PleD family two-component system response regulator [Fusibacter sp. 3D3]|uniref:response regulator n=1 Tax=Fusibacter sp. 3D3 TaxID=1048380 RepID=UPI0008534288|nr:response regulator [Fusibacter sp. 3D3]GAU79001.1 response regulator of zinc sigma-54-dependent two-component system [Fusibacter sp. 3D3]
MVGILVVDINTTTSYRIKKILENANVEIITATTSMETINRVSSSEKKIDLVIIDVQLGPEDGFDLISRIREIKEEIVICIVTSQNTRRSFVKGIKVGALDYILKPFEEDYLRQKLIFHIDAIEMAKSIPNRSPKTIDQAVYNAVKKAIREGYELMIGLFVLYHTSNETTVDVNIKDLAILKSMTHYFSSHLTVEDEFFTYGSNGAVVIMPKHKLDQKKSLIDDFEKLLLNFTTAYDIKDTLVAFDFISLPQEVNPKENAISVLAKRVENKLK